MNTEARSSPRKIMRSQAIVVVPGLSPLRAKTKDVSLTGVCVLLPEQLAVGTSCSVGFEAPVKGKIAQVRATAKVIYSVLSGTEGFRTGLQFVQLADGSAKVLAELMM